MLQEWMKTGWMKLSLLWVVDAALWHCQSAASRVTLAVALHASQQEIDLHEIFECAHLKFTVYGRKHLRTYIRTYIYTHTCAMQSR